MNAQELTSLYNQLSNVVTDQQKEIDYQKQVIGKLLMRMTDLEIDVKQLQGVRVFEKEITKNDDQRSN
jgi:uncharacterized coiled-coil protein SlyX